MNELDNTFAEIAKIIEEARNNAYRKVNEELIFHRSLHCLVAMELKVGKFKPEYVSKMDFYLEGLDRQIRKPDENPSVGLLLCASKNAEVVEYAMSRTLSPMMVAQYQLQLPDKDVLRKKLQELSSLPELEKNTNGGKQ